MEKEEKILVYHPAFEHGLAILNGCFKSAGNAADATCRVFYGPSRSGKSQLLKEFCRRHPFVEHEKFTEMPVVFIEVPSTPTVKGFAQEILRRLGDPLWKRGNTHQMTIRVQEICEKCKVRVLAFDDFQHLVDANSNVPREAADFLKELLVRSQDEKANLANLSVVAVGLERGLEVFKQNDQLRGRFGAPIKFGPFDWEIEEDNKNFRAFIKQMKEDLSEFTFPGEDCSFARRIHWASYGLIGYSMKVVRRAAKRARRAKVTQITLKHLEIAFNEEIGTADLNGAANPFSNGFKVKEPPARLVPESDVPTSRRPPRLKLTA
jgi:hypothetical protein